MPSRLKIEKRFRQALESEEKLLRIAEDPARLDRRATRVSAWWVAQHVEHLAKTSHVILDFLERFLEEGGETGRGGPNFIGRLVLWTRFIPRGSADVPDFLAPAPVESGQIDAEALARQIGDSRARLAKLESHLDELTSLEGTQPHPLLGHFTVLQWIDFLIIHHHHHFKIIRDIDRDLARRGEAAAA